MSVPEGITEKAKNIALNLLPAKSREQYEKEYDLFTQWRHENNVTGVNEAVLLTYVHEKSQTLKPSSVWSKYSMLKATLAIKENVNIETYSKVTAFLKRNAVGYQPKKSKVLSRNEVNTFLKEASDQEYLMIKVALVIGICGACRREELHSLQMSDVVENNNSLIVTLADTKTNRKRIFSVTGEGEAINPLELYHKYVSMRPKAVPHDYLFIAYRNKKCTIQRVGIHSFGKMPSVVAQYLKLANPELYTGHCFRRTSATMVADAGAELVTLKRLGGWRSSTVAESYVEDSIENKRKVSRMILGSKEISPVTSAVNEVTAVASTSTANVEDTSYVEGLFSGNSFKYAKNCNFTFHISK